MSTNFESAERALSWKTEMKKQVHFIQREISQRIIFTFGTEKQLQLINSKGGKENISPSTLQDHESWEILRSWDSEENDGEEKDAEKELRRNIAAIPRDATGIHEAAAAEEEEAEEEEEEEEEKASSPSHIF